MMLVSRFASHDSSPLRPSFCEWPAVTATTLLEILRCETRKRSMVLRLRPGMWRRTAWTGLIMLEKFGCSTKHYRFQPRLRALSVRG